MASFEIDELVADCQAALKETEPRRAVRELLARAVSQPDAVAAAMGPATKAELVPLFVDDTLSVMKVVWAPGMSINPHDHRIWAAIGVYGGQEDNTFYRLDADGRLVTSGRAELQQRDASTFGAQTIHAVVNPNRSFTGAIHVYGGDLVAQQGRRQWNATTLEEEPMSMDAAQRYFAEVNEALERDGSAPSA